MKKTIPLTTIILLLLFACEPKIEEFLAITGYDKEITVKSTGETLALDISASQKPTVTAGEEWVTTRLRRENNTMYSYEVTVKANNDTEQREAEVRVSAGQLSETVTIRQEAAAEKEDTTDTPVIKTYTLTHAGEQSVTAISGQDTLMLGFVTDVPLDSLDVSVDQDWMTAERLDTLIQVTLQDFHLLETRTAAVTLSSRMGGLEPLQWEVIQEPTVVTPEGMVEFEDFRFKKAVVDLHDADADNEISVAEAEAITELDVSGMGIRSVKGIEPMCNLRKLDITDNEMNAITSEPGVTPIVFDEEKIVKIDLSNPHPYLTEISIDGGVDLDISGCPPVLWRNSKYVDRTIYVRNLIQYEKQRSAQVGSFGAFYENLTVVPDTCRSRDFSRDMEAVRLQTHTRGKGIRIWFTILALTDKDIESDLDDRIAEQVLEKLFLMEPMKSYRDCFDVDYVINVAPVRKGHTEWENLPNENSSYRHWEQGRHAPLNITVYPHSTSTDNFSNAFVPGLHTDSILHEYWGHVFLSVVDEYNVKSGAPTQEWKERYKNNVNYRNLSFSPNPEDAPWKKFFELPQYHNHVGVFEGGYYEKEMYRSSYGGLMGAGQWGNAALQEYMNPWQRYLIVVNIINRSELYKELFPEFKDNVPGKSTDPEFLDAFFNYFVEQDKAELQRVDDFLNEHYSKSFRSYEDTIKEYDLSWGYKQQLKAN